MLPHGIPHFGCQSRDQELLSSVCGLGQGVGGGVDKGKEHMRKGVSGLLFEKRQEKYTVCLGSRVPALFKTCIS